MQPVPFRSAAQPTEYFIPCVFEGRLLRFWLSSHLLRISAVKTSIFVAGSFALVLAVAATAARAANPVPVAQYNFNGTLASTVPGAPPLKVTDPLSRSGFGSDLVFGVEQTVWNFNGSHEVTKQAGLTLDTQGLITDSKVYSVEMVFKFTQHDDKYRRILDVAGRQSDSGFYVDPYGRLNVYPGKGGSAFTNDVYHDVFLVNNGGVVTFYLDGLPQATVKTKVMDLDASQTINFFLDNLVGSGLEEYSSGSVAMIRLYNEALNAAPPQVPEPTSLAMLLTGLCAISAERFRRRQQFRAISSARK
jgi:hypothetical protein